MLEPPMPFARLQTQMVCTQSEPAEILFFFFWWGLLHGPQQGPDRKKEKYKNTYKTGKRKTPA